MYKFTKKVIFTFSYRNFVSTTKSSTTKSLYDLVVIGGGSGGLAVSREAASLGAKVALLDYVCPSTTRKITWGIGGTCVNAGCIPKKLFHYVGRLGTIIQSAETMGWSLNCIKKQVDWSILQNATENYIKRLNFMYRTRLVSDKIHYINAYGKLKAEAENENLTVEYINPKSNELHQLNSKYVALATGVRPVVPSNLVGKEYCITSDDLFYLKKPPGNTLVIGGSYIAIETAGFLAQLGFPVTLAIRSVALRNFDRDCVSAILKSLQNVGVALLLDTQLLRVETLGKNKPLNALLKTGKTSPESFSPFDTIVLATGRKPIDSKDPIAVCKRDNHGFIQINDKNETNIKNVFALGDVTNKTQLTPVAIRAGELLAQRLFGKSAKVMSYDNIPTTIFGPLEFASVGLSEEQAKEKYSTVNVYVQQFEQLESAFAQSKKGTCLAKIVCENDTILGLHLVAPHASEIMQGFALALGKSKSNDLDTLLGIHPTIAEVFTQLKHFKGSGVVSENYHSGVSCGGGKCG